MSPRGSSSNISLTGMGRHGSSADSQPSGDAYPYPSSTSSSSSPRPFTSTKQPTHPTHNYNPYTSNPNNTLNNLNLSSSAFNHLLNTTTSRAIELDDEELEEEEDLGGPPPLPDLAEHRASYRSSLGGNGSGSGSAVGGKGSPERLARRSHHDEEFDF